MSEWVCGRCVVNDSLRELIDKDGSIDECDFCGTTTSKVLHVEQVGEHILERLCADYDTVENVLGRADGDWVGEHIDTWTLLDNLQLGCEDAVLQAIHDAVDDGQEWCDSDINGTPGEVLAAGWDEFQRIVKHENRYFLTDETERSDYNPSALPPSHTLELVASQFDEYCLFSKLVQGEVAYRVRDVMCHEPAPTKPREFGPPPLDHCVQSNRMNPPGISAMYVSLDPDTCVAEVPRSTDRKRFLASFEVKQDIPLLDITNIPPPPSILQEGDPSDRHMLEFLDAFSKMCAQPVERANRVHVDYVPTQVVCEYLMRKFKDRGVKGIKYPSTKSSGHNVALFVDPDCIADELSDDDWRLGEPLFELTDSGEV